MVTTIIANYNYGKYLEECIDACINQTKKNYIVVGDDTSSDNSVQIATDLLKTDIVYQHGFLKIYKGDLGMVVCFPKNGGPSIVRNTCIGLTFKETEYYNIVDADDVPYKNKIQTMLKYFDNQTGLVYADYDQYNEGTGLTIREYKPSYSYKRLHQECIIHSNFMVTQKCLASVSKEYGFYNPQLKTCEDWDLELRIARTGWKIVHVPQSLTKVRVHNNSSVHYRSKEEWNNNWKYIRQNYPL